MFLTSGTSDLSQRLPKELTVLRSWCADHFFELVGWMAVIVGVSPFFFHPLSGDGIFPIPSLFLNEVEMWRVQ
jgi:hypothetical protein